MLINKHWNLLQCKNLLNEFKQKLFSSIKQENKLRKNIQNQYDQQLKKLQQIHIQHSKKRKHYRHKLASNELIQEENKQQQEEEDENENLSSDNNNQTHHKRLKKSDQINAIDSDEENNKLEDIKKKIKRRN